MSTSKISKTKAQAPLPWATFGEYLLARIRSKGLTRLRVAKDLGLDPSHMTRLIKGKGNPAPETCKRVARYFEDPTSIPLRLAGWLNGDDINIDDFAREFTVALNEDPDLQLLYKTYLEQGSPEARRAFVRSIRAAFGQRSR